MICLSEWLDKHRGVVVQIGTRGGSGFLYAGKAGRFTLDAMRSAYINEFSNVPIVEYMPSFYGGFILIIEGFQSGSAELPPELVPKFPEAPIECYIHFADYWAGYVAKEYKSALVSLGIGRGGSVEESNAIRAESFFRSDTFSIICPKADGEELIRLIKKQARKDIEEHGKRRKEQASKWLY